MILNLVKNKTPTYMVSIRDEFTTDLKDDCPIVSYSIRKVIQKNSKEPIASTDYLKLFSIDS